MPLPFVCFESWFVTCKYHPALPSRTSCGIKSATLRVFSCQVNFMAPWNWWNSLGSKLGWTIDLMTYDLSPWLKFRIPYSLLQLTWEIWEKRGLKASKCDEGVHSSWKIDLDSCTYKIHTNLRKKIQFPSKFCHTTSSPMLRPARVANFSGLPLEFACSSLRIWSKTGEALSSSCPSCSHIFLRMETLRLSWACCLFAFLGSSICHELVDLCILQHAEFHLAFWGLVHLNASTVRWNNRNIDLKIKKQSVIQNQKETDPYWRNSNPVHSTHCNTNDSTSWHKHFFVLTIV